MKQHHCRGACRWSVCVLPDQISGPLGAFPVKESLVPKVRGEVPWR
jgi:hypothetical protein